MTPLHGYLSLGSNLGDRQANLAAALARLEADPRLALIAQSGLYESAPVGFDSPNLFINQVVKFSWGGALNEFWQLVLEVQASGGRTEDTGEGWADRTIDIDVLSIEPSSESIPELTLPHPRAHLRAFVLIPWAEIAPKATLRSRSLAAWIRNLPAGELNSVRPV